MIYLLAGVCSCIFNVKNSIGNANRMRIQWMEALQSECMLFYVRSNSQSDHYSFAICSSPTQTTTHIRTHIQIWSQRSVENVCVVHTQLFPSNVSVVKCLSTVLVVSIAHRICVVYNLQFVWFSYCTIIHQHSCAHQWSPFTVSEKKTKNSKDYFDFVQLICS